MITRLVTREVTESPTRLAAGLPIPLLLMPLETDLRLLRGVGSATFTRSTIGTFVDKDTGLVKTAAIDAARFEQNGILIEGASTNLLLRSEEFDNAAWVKTRATISADSSVSPDGASTADKLVENTATGIHLISQNKTGTFDLNETFTFSKRIRASGRDKFQLDFTDSVFGVNAKADFDLTAKTTTPGSSATSTITELVNNWFICTLTATVTTTGAGDCLLRLKDAGGNLSYTGDGVSGLDLWGGSLEELPFASSYIKTVASTATRTADNLSIDAANIPAPTLDYSVSATVDLIGQQTSDIQNLYQVVGESERHYNARNFSTPAIGGRHGPTFRVGVKNPAANEILAHVITKDSSDFKFYIDGAIDTTSAVETVTGTATSIRIGDKGSGNQVLFGHIKNLRTDKVALTQPQAGALP